MFRISRKADYAVLIMCQLALREGDLRARSEFDDAEALPPISAQEIATGGQLSRALTANLMKLMTKPGLLESVRGASGGYRLGKDPKDISLTQILAAVEGPLALVECASHMTSEPQPAATETENCALTHCCPSRRAMRLVHQRVANLFDDISLAELIQISAPEAAIRSF